VYEGEFLNGKKMEEEKNILIMINYFLKENILMDYNGMEKDMMEKVMWNMNYMMVMG